MPHKYTRRGRTIWRGRVRKNGREVTREFDTKAEAREWEELTRAEARPLVVKEPPTQTPSTSLLTWANEYLSYAVRYVPKTFSEKRSVFRLLFKELSPNMPAAELTAKHALDYLQGQFGARSGYAANRDRKNLAAAWAWGIKYLGLPTANPFLQVDRFPEVRSHRYVPPVADFEDVLAVAQGQSRVLLLAHLYLAARRGELYRLLWTDVDFAGERVRIGTRKRQDGSMEYEWVPMAEELYDALLAHRQTSRTEHVFAQETGRFRGRPFLENRGFPQELCQEAGVKPFGNHAIRHLTASILASRNIPMVTIQAILRHKKLATTERYVRGLSPVRPALEILRKGDQKGTKGGTKRKPGGASLRVVESK